MCLVIHLGSVGLFNIDWSFFWLADDKIQPTIVYCEFVCRYTGNQRIINLDTSFVVALNWSANVIIYQPFEYSTYQYIQIVNLKKIAPDFWCILYIERMVFSSIFIQICSINTSVDFMVGW